MEPKASNTVSEHGWILPAIVSAILALLWAPFVFVICYGVFAGG